MDGGMCITYGRVVGDRSPCEPTTVVLHFVGVGGNWDNSIEDQTMSPKAPPFLYSLCEWNTSWTSRQPNIFVL